MLAHESRHQASWLSFNVRRKKDERVPDIPKDSSEVFHPSKMAGVVCVHYRGCGLAPVPTALFRAGFPMGFLHEESVHCRKSRALPRSGVLQKGAKRLFRVRDHSFAAGHLSWCCPSLRSSEFKMKTRPNKSPLRNAGRSVRFPSDVRFPAWQT